MKKLSGPTYPSNYHKIIDSLFNGLLPTDINEHIAGYAYQYTPHPVAHHSMVNLIDNSSVPKVSQIIIPDTFRYVSSYHFKTLRNTLSDLVLARKELPYYWSKYDHNFIRFRHFQDALRFDDFFLPSASILRPCHSCKRLHHMNDEKAFDDPVCSKCHEIWLCRMERSLLMESHITYDWLDTDHGRYELRFLYYCTTIKQVKRMVKHYDMIDWHSNYLIFSLLNTRGLDHLGVEEFLSTYMYEDFTKKYCAY